MANDFDALRGLTLTIGKLTFPVPMDLPVTDEEVIEHEELIADIETASKPARDEADLAKSVQKGLRESVTECMRLRRTADDGPGLFPAETPATAPTQAAGGQRSVPESGPKVRGFDVPSGKRGKRAKAAGKD